MKKFAAAHTQGTDPETLARELAAQIGRLDGYNLGFVYVTSPLAPKFAALVEALRSATGLAFWVGTAGHGICASGTEYWGEPAVAILTCRLPDGSFCALPSTADPASAETAALGVATGFGVVHGDPRNASLTEALSSLARERGTYLVGGLTSANSAYPQAAGDKVVEGGVSGVLMGSGVNVAVGLTQGCTPIGPAHHVTKGEGQVLALLDGQRAYDVLCEDIGIAEEADPRPWLANIHAAIPVAGSDEADYLVRNLVGIDPGRGLVAIAEVLGRGERVMFVRRDAASAEKDLERMLDKLDARVTGKPKAGLYFSCVARGPNLFQEASHEMKAIRAAFGDIPMAGFFGNGEISNDRVYAYTGVLALFS